MLRRTVVAMSLWALLAQGCAPEAFLVPTAGLAAELSGRHPRLLAEAGGGAAPTASQRVLPQLSPVDLETARRLERNGDAAAARQMLGVLLEREPGIAAAARLELARLALDEGEPGQAIGHLQILLRDHGQRAERVPATYLLALAERRGGDTRAAIARLEDYLRQSDLLAPYARLLLADWYTAAGDPERGLAEAWRVLESPASRRLRIEALERLAVAAAERGDLAAAQARWEEIATLAGTASYRAEVQWQLGEIARRRGDWARAGERYRAVVAEYPATARAGDALRALNEHGLDGLISYYEAGLVRHHRGEHERALGGFEAQLAQGGSDDELAGASYYRALVLQRLNRATPARAAYQEMAAAFPGSPHAPNALYRAAQLIEGAERYRDAAAAYRALAAVYPRSDAGQLAAFRAGFALRHAGAVDEALATWAELGAQTTGRTVRNTALGAPLNPKAALLYWSGKLLAAQGRQGEARARWQEAAAAGPDEYHGLRAKVALASEGTPASGLDAARLAPPTADAALTAWLAGLGAPDARALATELAADVSWRRGAALWALGRHAEAGWEFDDLRDRLAGDAPRLYALGVALRDLGADHLALQVGGRLFTASGASAVTDLPRAARALLYPTPYADLVAAQTARWGVDPLLFYALIRQESAFDPRARSSANARGLSQVIPSTARDIARQLGRAVDDDDLYRPAVNVELGTYYLGQALRQFQGNVYPALAGYNAGPGNAARWLRNPGAADVDVYAEQIPYAETYHYVKKVYENYQLYRDLYAS
jgi:soluble lytic murein transglycosylase